MQSFCHWLQSTSISQILQNVEWIIPLVQTIHILAVATLVSSALMVDLRVLRTRWTDQSAEAVALRFLPFIWWALPILLATGALLIVAEPERSLRNPTFYLKMGLLTAAACATLAYQIPMRRDVLFWEHSAARRRGARLIAAASLPLWIAVIFAGRWIAYTQGGG